MSDSLHIVCPDCGGINRVPASRLMEGGHCGKCKASLFQGEPLELDDAGLERNLGKSDIPLLVDFWAPWCGPCKMMAPSFAQAARRLEPSVRLAKLNTEIHQINAGKLGIRSIPTMILFHRGKEIERISGAMDENGIVSWVQKNLA